MELVNALRADNVCDKGVAEELVVMLAPFVPHFAEECWERLGHTGVGVRGELAGVGRAAGGGGPGRGRGADQREDAVEGAGGAGCG